MTTLKMAHRGKASTENCKTLLAGMPHTIGRGVWKRVHKSGSAPLIRRIFQHSSGLYALVIENATDLFFGGINHDIDVLHTLPSEELDESLTLPYALAPQHVLKAYEDMILSAIEQDNLGGPVGSEELYYHLVKLVVQTPQGSPERIAFGNLFEFCIPVTDNDPDDMPVFMITSRFDVPSGDHPHFLEDVLGGDIIESPNESCDHWVHKSPVEAIQFLCEAGIRFNPETQRTINTAMESTMEQSYYDALISLSRPV